MLLLNSKLHGQITATQCAGRIRSNFKLSGETFDEYVFIAIRGRVYEYKNTNSHRVITALLDRRGKTFLAVETHILQGTRPEQRGEQCSCVVS